MNFLKKAFLGLTAATTIAGAKAETPKTAEKLTPDTKKTTTFKASEKTVNAIDFTAAKEKMEQSKTLKQEMELAQQNLIQTQMEFKAEIAKLLKTHAHDPLMTSKLNEISDLSDKATVFSMEFLKDRIDNLDSAKIAEYVQDAIEFAQSPQSPMFFKETKTLKDLDEALLGSVIREDGYNTTTNRVEAGMIPSKTQTAKAFLGGQDNIFLRLITTNIQYQAKKAAMEKQAAHEEMFAKGVKSGAINETTASYFEEVQPETAEKIRNSLASKE